MNPVLGIIIGASLFFSLTSNGQALKPGDVIEKSYSKERPDNFELEFKSPGDAHKYITNKSGIKRIEAGDIEGFGLMTDIAEASISGSGSIEATVNESLKARISGSGNVRYKGNPTTDSKVSGSGNISKR